jgi:hypothetical protein
MAKLYNAMGYTSRHPTKILWENAAFHFQEVLRLNSNDDFSLYGSFPLILINCDRMEDAYTFARYHGFNYDDMDWSLHEGTKEGDWIYPKLEGGALYKDIYQEFPDEKRVGFACLADHVAIFIIKLRLIAAFDAKKKRGDNVSEEEVDQVEQVRNVQVPGLMDVIHEGNPTMLPALINPAPLLSQPPPRMSAMGKPSEAASVLIDAIGPFNRTPGGREVLVERFGPFPAYDTNLDPLGLFRGSA